MLHRHVLYTCYTHTCYTQAIRTPNAHVTHTCYTHVMHMRNITNTYKTHTHVTPLAPAYDPKQNIPTVVM